MGRGGCAGGPRGFGRAVWGAAPERERGEEGERGQGGKELAGAQGRAQPRASRVRATDALEDPGVDT